MFFNNSPNRENKTQKASENAVKQPAHGEVNEKAYNIVARGDKGPRSQGRIYLKPM